MCSEGIDEGATFQVLYCRNCDAAVGRLYVSTPSELDAVRDNFTFLEEGISSYQVSAACRRGVRCRGVFGVCS